MADTRFGLILPHFGEHATVENIVEGARKAEAYGFDFVCARDHVVYHPHGMEDPDRTFVDPFTTLSALATATDEIGLATAVAIPLRHPLHLAQSYACLDWMAGGGRVDAGIGAGNFRHEFEAVGRPFDDRPGLVRENVEILRRVWTGAGVSYDGEHFSFEDVEMYPQPDEPIPIWYGGSTPASVRRAVSYCDGWWPGRIPLRTYEVRTEQLRELSAERGRDPPKTAFNPFTSVGADRETAIGKANVDGLLASANDREWWVEPESGSFSTVEDLRGVLLAGTPEDVVGEIRAFQDAGVDRLAFDLRHRFDEFHRCLDLLGEAVIPEVS